MIFAVSVALAGPCDEIGPALDAAEAALQEVRTDEADARLRAAEDALVGCDRVVERAQLGRMWMIEGVLRYVQEDIDAATLAFGSASRVAPDVWSATYGPKLEAHWKAAAAAPRWPGRIRVEPALGGNVHWLDGREVAGEVASVSGLHLVQVADPDGVVRFGQVVVLAADQTLTVDSGVPTAPVPVAVMPEVVPAPIARRRPVQPLPVIAVATAITGAGLLGLSAERYVAVGSPSVDTGTELRQTWRTAVGAGAGGLGLLAVSGLSVGLHLAN